MKSSKSFIITLTIIFLYALISKNVFAWENIYTHPAITQKAVENSVLNVGDYLQSPRKTTTVEN